MSREKKTLALVLPDGITLRNFVYSSFIEEASKDFRLVIFHFVDKSVFKEIDEKLTNQITFYKIETFREGILAKVYRYAKLKASLLLNFKSDPNPTFLNNFPAYKKYAFPERMLFRLSELLATNATQKKVESLEKLHVKWFDTGNKSEIHNAREIITKENVSIVLNAHQRDVKSLPVMRAAQWLNIKTVNFIYSWDNLPKGRMAVPADHFFVWSDHMKSEMNRYYPDIKNERISVTGTPQFEFYHRFTKTPREKFAAKHGLDPDKKWYLYSGDMTDASPFDQHYLEDVYNAWCASNEKENTQLVFRRAPTDNTGRFNEVLAKCPEIVAIEPLWKQFGKHSMTFAVSKEDVQMLVDIIEHCYTAVNFGSTMAHDFAQRKKRVFYINYEHPLNKHDTWTSAFFYRYTHFESLEGLNAVEWVYDKSEISPIFAANFKDAGNGHMQWHNKISKDTNKAVVNIVNNLKLLTE